MNKDFFDDYFDDSDNESSEPMTDEDDSQKPKLFTKGFLAALAVCLTAVGAAVWTTVSSVDSYLEPSVVVSEKSSESSTAETDAKVNAPIVSSKPETADTDEEVVFRCEPIKNKRMIQKYSETPIYSKTMGDYRAHAGIDYEANIGDKVRAMAKGVVKDFYHDDLLGNVLVIEHSENVESYYCGLAKTALVQPGDVVSAGDFIGTVYAIPGEAADPAHVHVAVKENGKYQDPQKYMTDIN
ncbi:MAG: M23 family metallopeptidase [Clostridia bacterium]|nr:M23 family metallopeptidase [Clostridia bacterium]